MSDKCIPSTNPVPLHSPLIKKVCEIISQAWGLKHTIDYNPCTTPTILNKTFFTQHIEKNPTEYMVSVKSTGTRYLLVLGMYERKGFCVFVDKSMQMFEVPILATSDYFHGSVFDGDLVCETIQSGQYRQKYFVYDLISMKGETRKNDTFLKRYNEYFGVFDLEGKDILDMDNSKWETYAYEWAETKDKIVSLGNKFALQFYPKPFVQFLHMGSLWRNLAKTNNKSDGLVIVKSTSLASMGSDSDCIVFKWKEHHTINLIIQSNYVKGKWVFKSYFYDQDKKMESSEKTFELNKRQFYLQLKENNITESTCRYFAELHKTSFTLVGKCMCELDEHQPILWYSVIKWQQSPIKPHTFGAIQKTLYDIHNNIPISDLLRLNTSSIYQTVK
jgi:hypothetical protein